MTETPEMIYKYSLEVTGETQVLKMPRGGRIIKFGVQNDQICLWYLFELENENKLSPRRFTVIPTGVSYNGFDNKYIDTVQMGPFVWHIFEDLP